MNKRYLVTLKWTTTASYEVEAENAELAKERVEEDYNEMEAYDVFEPEWPDFESVEEMD